MGSFLFHEQLEMSPYSDLIDPTHWAEILQLFTRVCFRVWYYLIIVKSIRCINEPAIFFFLRFSTLSIDT